MSTAAVASPMPTRSASLMTREQFLELASRGGVFQALTVARVNCVPNTQTKHWVREILRAAGFVMHH